MRILTLLWFIGAYLFLSLKVVGQAVIPNFTLPTDVCLGENLLIDNQSTNSTSQVWDFCFDALDNAMISRQIGDLNDDVTPDDPEAIALGFDNGQWYGFVLSRDNNRLFRFELNNDLDVISKVSGSGCVIVQVGSKVDAYQVIPASKIDHKTIPVDPILDQHHVGGQ